MRKYLGKIKKALKRVFCNYQYNEYKKYCLKNNQNEFLIFNTPNHGNIGDHAIALAEYKMLEKLNIKPFEIPTFEDEYYFEYIKNNISKNATISITGGGFIGSQWTREMDLVNKVIDTYREHKIIIFPHTFYFKEDETGKKELEKSTKIFNRAKNLNIFTREEKSYNFVKSQYPKAKVFLVPDIVLALNETMNLERSGILSCFRSDVEGIFNDSEKAELLKIIEKYDENINHTDTVVHESIKPKNREERVMQKIKEFASARLVVTDRLHGMVFAAITNTPCIALSNYNYKVEGVYKWIKEKNEDIIFENNIKNVENDIKILLRKKHKETKLEKYDFEKLYMTLEEK